MRERIAGSSRIGGLVVIATALNIGLGGAPYAQDGTYTPPPKGFEQTWKHESRKGGKLSTSTLIHTVISSSGEEVVYRTGTDDDTNGDRVHLFRGIFSYAYYRPGQYWAEFKFDRAAIRGLWPLAAGKEAVAKARFGYGRGKTIEAAKAQWKETEIGTIRYRVLRKEMVTTPAGTFEAFVIQRNRRFTVIENKSVRVQQRTAWFVPSLGYVVKQTVRYGTDSPKMRYARIEAVAIKNRPRR